MDELFSKNGKLISKNDWENRIKELKPEQELEYSEEKIARDVKKLFEEAVKIRVENVDQIGIMFSGGLDSSLIAAICKKQKVNFTCYTVGFQDGNFKEPDDVVAAKEIAKHLKLSPDEFKFKLFSIKEIEPIIKRVARILKDISECNNSDIQTVVSVEVGSVEAAAYSISQKEQIFFSGLGSEEIFAGYDRHRKNPTNEECFRGLLNMYDRDLLRDSAIPKALGFNFTTPFLDKELIQYSLAIPIKYKINDEGSKMVLRKAAMSYLGKFSERPKKAAQYGSSLDKAIAKLALIHKSRYKKDYIRSLQ